MADGDVRVYRSSRQSRIGARGGLGVLTGVIETALAAASGCAASEARWEAWANGVSGM